jgi:anti-sigma-K factor RskA
VSTVGHEPYETLAAVYAVGALDGDDLAQFEAHLPGCPICQAAVRDAQNVLARAALTAPPQIPPPDVRHALLRRVAGAAPARRRPWLPWAVGAAVAAVFVAAFSGAFVASRYEGKLGQMAREMAALKERTARNEAELQQQVTLYRGAVDLLRDPATRVVELRGQGPSPAATAKMIWHERAGGQLFVAGLPAAPAGKVYELWTIAGSAPKPAGLFNSDEQGRAVYRVPAENAGEVKVFAVTLEVEGGVPAPTGPMVLASR